MGILEEVPGVHAGEKSHFGVRVAFEQNLGGWHAFPFECGNPGCLVSVTKKYPRETRWTVSSNGRILGTVLARTPADFAFYSHVGIQTVADGEQVPRVGNRSTDYSGFLESPVQRPLLATAGAPKVGPAHGGWHLSLVDPRDAKRVWPLFQDGPMSHRSAYWYYRQSDGAIRLLPGQDTFAADATGPFAELVMPLDFVDLLGDGKDEALFLMAGYDAGGYALFYDDFRKVTTFQWTYH